MTAQAVGTRCRDRERVRFFRALGISIALHAATFAVKVGPMIGSRLASAPGGGRIEAVLKRAPASNTAVDQASSVAELLPPTLALAEFRATVPRPADLSEQVQAAGSASQPTPPPAADGLREEGRDSAAGSVASVIASDAIPLLPPLPGGAQNIQGPPALRAPLNFSYPPNMRIQGGRVRVRLLLDTKGQIEEMKVVASEPPGLFDHAATQVLRSGSFVPGYSAKRPVRSYLFVEVTFGPGPMGQQIRYAGSALGPPKYAN